MSRILDMRASTPWFRLGCVLALLLAGGCANRSLSQHQCAAGDWQTVGYSDALQGYAQSRILTHQNACGRHQVIPDSTAYRAGWKEGIAEYCTAENGYDRGLAGHAYPTVCPAPHRAQYRAAYDNGRELFLARHEVQRLEQLIHRNERRIDTIGNQLIDSAAAQIDPTLTPKERVDLLTRTKSLLDERDRLQAELPDLNRALDFAIADLDELEQQIAARS